MTIGLLYDVHGNLPALEAVLADAPAVDGWVLGGDYASFGAWPVEVVERMDALPNAVWIRGNWDRWQGGDAADLPDQADLREALAAVRAALGPAIVERLAALPATHRDGETLFCHASPASDMDLILPDPGEHDDEMLAGTDARRVVFGHTHLAFTREYEGVELVNPGSIGLPFDGDPRAAYAVLRPEGVELRRAKYDVEAAIAKLGERFGERPWATGTIDRLRSATYFV